MANLADSTIDLEVRTAIANTALALADAWMEFGAYTGNDAEQREFLLNKAFGLQHDLRHMAIKAGNVL